MQSDGLNSGCKTQITKWIRFIQISETKVSEPGKMFLKHLLQKSLYQPHYKQVMYSVVITLIKYWQLQWPEKTPIPYEYK